VKPKLTNDLLRLGNNLLGPHAAFQTVLAILLGECSFNGSNTLGAENIQRELAV
jgi:hypothetical protein